MTAIILFLGFAFLILVLDGIDNVLRRISDRLSAINDTLKELK